MFLGLRVGIGVALVVLLLWQFDLLASVRLSMSNAFYVPREASGSVVLVAMDDASLQAYGRMPAEWDRALHAQLVRFLADSGARVVTFDVLFAEPTDADQALHDAIDYARFESEARTRVVMPVVGAQPDTVKTPYALGYRHFLTPTESLNEVVAGLGHVNTCSDADGVVRRVPTRITDDQQTWFALSISTYLSYLRIPMDAASTVARYADGTLFLPGDRRVPVDKLGCMLVNYVSSPNSTQFPVYSYLDVIEGRVAPDAFAGKIVFVGLMHHTGLNDLYFVPTGLRNARMPGVEIHANALETLLQNIPLRAQGRTSQGVMIVVLALFASCVYAYSVRRWYSALLVPLGLVGVWLVGTFIYFNFEHQIINLFHSLLSLLLPAPVILIFHGVEEARQRQQAEWLLHSLVNVARQRLDVDRMVPSFTSDLCRMLHCERAEFWAWNAEEGRLERSYVHGDGLEALYPTPEHTLMLQSLRGDQVIARDGEVAVPFRWYEKPYGVLYIWGKGRLSPTKVALLELFARQTALLLANATLFKQTQHQAREIAHREARYRLLAENITDKIWTATLDGKFTYVSAASKRIFGYTPEEMLELDSRALIVPSSYPRARQALQILREHIRRHQPDELPPSVTVEIEAYRKDGSTIWVETTMTVVFDESGQPAELLGVTRDISVRRRMEEALRQSRERFELATRAARVCVWDWNASTGAFHMDDSVFGPYSQSDPQGRAGNVPPEDVAQLVAALESHLAGYTPELTLEYRMILPDGRSRWFMIRGRAIYGEDGRLARLLGTIMDVTQRRRVEDELRASERKFRGLVEQSYDGIVLIDENGRIIEWNHGQERITGIPREETLGQFIWDVQYAALPAKRQDEMERDKLREMWMEVFRTGHAPWLGRLIEGRVQHRDGTIRIHQQMTFPVQTEQGYVVGTITRDVTPQKQTEEALQRAHDRLTTLRRVDDELTRSLDIQYVLSIALDAAVRLSLADTGLIALAEDEGVHVIRTIGGYANMAGRHIMRTRGIIGRAMRERKPLLVLDVESDPDYEAANPETRAQMVLPLMVRDRFIGVLSLETHDPTRFTPEVFEFLQLLSVRISVAVQNAQLYEQAQALAAQEERQRLARDLHDAVSQTLFSAKLLAEMLLRKLETNHMPAVELREDLQQIHMLTKSAQAEMRTLLLELRPSALFGTPLSDLLKHLTEAFSSRVGTPIALSITEQRTLPPDVRVVFYRIAQEALNNIVKHAEATEIAVTLHSSETQVKLSIKDNGRGFDIRRIPKDHLGVRIMHERAQSIGAQIHLTSVPGQGTEIVVTWAVEEAEREA